MADHDLAKYTEATTKFAVQLQQAAAALGTVAQEIKEIRSILYENQKIRMENVQKVIDNQRKLCNCNLTRIENAVHEAIVTAETWISSNKNEYLEDIRKNTRYTKWTISGIASIIFFFQVYSEYVSPSQDVQLHNIAHQLELISTKMKAIEGSQ